MEPSPSPSPSSWISSTASWLSSCPPSSSSNFSSQEKKNLPPGLPAIPILGHLQLLKPPLHRTLQSLSSRYGPIVFLRFGNRPVLLVSSPSIAEQCFTQFDVIFANRPKFLASKHLGYNYTTVGFAPYGDHWRNLRRVTSIQIFSATSLNHSSATRDEEIRFVVQKLFQKYDGAAQKVDLSSLFRELVFNVMTKMKLVDLQRRRDVFFQGLIDEHRRSKAGFSWSEQKKMIVEDLLALQEAEPDCYTDDIVKGITGKHIDMF
ncbi:unnamed protein product [Ilex paraguariensis]|uniref:Cytochrome P450 n=1 Tax=Ilex paraguariensis TaxID=185542 RepID=A0ABC8R4W0_9AQUA